MHAQPYITADTAEWLVRLVPHLVDKERRLFLMMRLIVNRLNK